MQQHSQSLQVRRKSVSNKLRKKKIERKKLERKKKKEELGGVVVLCLPKTEKTSYNLTIMTEQFK